MYIKSHQKPNIFLIIVDSLRYDYYLRYGLEYIKEFNPIVLRGVSPSTWTLPSYISIFFGKDVHEHNVWNFKSLKEVISKLNIIKPFVYWLSRIHGYETYMFTSNPWVSMILSRYFKHTYDLYPGKEYKVISYIKHGITYNDDVEKIFKILNTIAEKKDKPVFVNINLMLVHEPYTPIDGIIINALGYRAFSSTIWRKSLITIFRNNYYKHVKAAGKVIRSIVKKICESDDDNNAYIIITSDHGQLLGEYGLVGHGWLPVKELFEVPFVIISKHDDTIRPDTTTRRNVDVIVPLVKLKRIIAGMIRYGFFSIEHLRRLHKGIILSEVKDPGYCQGSTDYPYYVALIVNSTYKILKTRDLDELLRKINSVTVKY